MITFIFDQNHSIQYYTAKVLVTYMNITENLIQYIIAALKGMLNL